MQPTKLVQILLVGCFVILVNMEGVRMESADEDENKGNTHIVYDQRQSGKYNIHVVIKDVAIIEMDQNEIEDNNYNDEDYYYNDNDLTIKPITLNPTTPATTSTTTTEPINHKIATTNKITTLPDTETTLKPPPDETTILSSSLLWNTLSSLISQKPTSNGFASTETSTKDSGVTKQNIASVAVDVKPRSKVEPIYAIDDTSHQVASREDSIPLDQEDKTYTNSKIYKVKVHRSQQPYPYTPIKMQSRRCRSNQYRDLSGNCRIKRSHSGSLL